MIIWLASYPKSGNTWIRSFLVSLLFTKDGGSDLSNLNLIGQFPLRSQFANLVKDLSNVHEIKKKWVSAQEIINLDKKSKVFQNFITQWYQWITLNLLTHKILLE